jgi:hypothetical protein
MWSEGGFWNKGIKVKSLPVERSYRSLAKNRRSLPDDGWIIQKNLHLRKNELLVWLSVSLVFSNCALIHSDV